MSSTWSRRKLLMGAGVTAAALGFGAYKLSGPGGRAIDGRSRARPVSCDARPPPQSDVVIIGGGKIDYVLVDRTDLAFEGIAERRCGEQRENATRFS